MVAIGRPTLPCRSKWHPRTSYVGFRSLLNHAIPVLLACRNATKHFLPSLRSRSVPSFAHSHLRSGSSSCLSSLSTSTTHTSFFLPRRSIPSRLPHRPSNPISPIARAFTSLISVSCDGSIHVVRSPFVVTSIFVPFSRLSWPWFRLFVSHALEFDSCCE